MIPGTVASRLNPDPPGERIKSVNVTSFTDPGFNTSTTSRYTLSEDGLALYWLTGTTYKRVTLTVPGDISTAGSEQTCSLVSFSSTWAGIQSAVLTDMGDDTFITVLQHTSTEENSVLHLDFSGSTPSVTVLYSNFLERVSDTYLRMANYGNIAIAYQAASPGLDPITLVLGLPNPYDFSSPGSIEIVTVLSSASIFDVGYGTYGPNGKYHTQMVISEDYITLNQRRMVTPYVQSAGALSHDNLTHSFYVGLAARDNYYPIPEISNNGRWMVVRVDSSPHTITVVELTPWNNDPAFVPY